MSAPLFLPLPPPPAPSRWRRLAPHALGLVLALGAAPATLAGVLALNSVTDGRTKATGPREVAFEVAPPPPPPPKPKPRKSKQRPRPAQPQRRALPPPPSLGPQLSGVDVGAGAFAPTRLQSIDEAALGNLEDVVHTEDTVDERPRPRVQTPIEVPASARARNLSGRLVLSLLIGKDGTVRQAKVLEAEPPGVFEAAALAAVRTWEFDPATYHGQPVEVWATLPVQFQP